MSKFKALKAFRGLEGPVRVGQILDPKEHPTLDETRVKALTRNGLIEPYSDRMRAAPRNQALASPRDPAGMTSPNAGGMTVLGWEPGAPEAEGGNGEAGESTTEAAPAGSSISPIGASSSSGPDQAPATPTSAASSNGRPIRGRRRS